MSTSIYGVITHHGRAEIRIEFSKFRWSECEPKERVLVCGDAILARLKFQKNVSTPIFHRGLSELRVTTENAVLFIVTAVKTWSSKSKSLYDWQSVSMPWYRAPLWDLRPDIISCRNVAVWNLRSCIYWAPCLTRGRVCNLQCNHSIVRVAQNP
jgi:hypothetical protein